MQFICRPGARTGISLIGFSGALGRAQRLANKNSAFYTVDPDKDYLWCETEDENVLRPIRLWVQSGFGVEPA